MTESARPAMSAAPVPSRVSEATAPDAEAVLASWLADEARVQARIAAGRAEAAQRAASHGPPGGGAAAVAGEAGGAGSPPLVPDLRAFASQPGIALFEALLDGRAPPAPIAGTLDFMLVGVSPGRAVFQGRPLTAHYNPLGTVHGGWFATLLDSALGCAVHSALPPGKAYTTLELKVNIVRALTTRVPRVRAEGRTIHVGGQVATAEATLSGPDGRLYAHATTTCLVFPLRD